MLQEGNDCTVPLALTTALSALLLLLLLCICTVLWYRQRRQASRHFPLTEIALGEKYVTSPYTFPVQKVWLKYNEEDRRLHAATLHCPALAFTKGTQYFFWQRQNISCQQKAFSLKKQKKHNRLRSMCMNAGLLLLSSSSLLLLLLYFPIVSSIKYQPRNSISTLIWLVVFPLLVYDLQDVAET